MSDISPNPLKPDDEVKSPLNFLEKLDIAYVVLGIFLVAGIVGIVLTPPASHVAKQAPIVEATPQPSPPVSAPPVTPEPPVQLPLPKHKIVYTLSGERGDGGSEIFVQIPPVNLSNENFKSDIQRLVDQIVQDNGSSISIEFLDDKRALEALYQQQHNHMPLTSRDNHRLETHYIAGFSGNLPDMGYNNTLMYFLATDSSNPKVGKYVSSMEYNPAPISSP